MKKFRCYVDFYKEEKWLESMALQGWGLKRQGFFYSFVSAQPEEVNIKIDYRFFKNQSDYINYCQLFEDSGWKLIAGSKNNGNQYFKKISENSDDDIFSDNASRAGRYKRLSYMMLYILIILLPLVIFSYFQGTLSLEIFINPKVLYLTPGLWDKTGVDFWRRFIFETPFALMRGFSWSLTFILIVAYLFLTIKSWVVYKKAQCIDD